MIGGTYGRISTNRIRTAVLAESIATVMARAAYHLAAQGQAATAEALLQQARHNRIQALRLRAEARAERCLKISRADRIRWSSRFLSDLGPD